MQTYNALPVISNRSLSNEVLTNWARLPEDFSFGYTHGIATAEIENRAGESAVFIYTFLQSQPLGQGRVRILRFTF